MFAYHAPRLAASSACSAGASFVPSGNGSAQAGNVSSSSSGSGNGTGASVRTDPSIVAPCPSRTSEFQPPPGRACSTIVNRTGVM
jgi:hypothetical protein